MPALANPKHENLCQLTVQGMKHKWSQAEIYQRAGYSARGHSAEMAASRLMKKDEIRARIAELMQPIARKSQITAESLLDRLEANIEAAAAEKQHGAVNGSLRLMAELRGMLIQRTEIGSPGDFAGIETVADVAGAMLREMDAPLALATLDELRTLIEARAGQAAVVVSPPSYRRQDETGLALRTLRPSNGSRR